MASARAKPEAKQESLWPYQLYEGRPFLLRYSTHGDHASGIRQKLNHFQSVQSLIAVSASMEIEYTWPRNSIINGKKFENKKREAIGANQSRTLPRSLSY
jgi:hypothetical protein